MDLTKLDTLAQRVEKLVRERVQHATEKVIGEHPRNADKESILQLLYTEVTAREAQGESVTSESLVERFPQFAESIERLMAVHRQLGIVETDNLDAQFTTLFDTHSMLSDFADEDEKRFERLVPDRFKVKRLLGSGGMGLVYLAHDRQLERFVAIKILRSENFNEHHRTRLVREGQAAAILQHENIVSLFDIGVEAKSPYLCYEWVDGPSLLERLNETTLPPKTAADIALQICRGIALAHQHDIVHRDIKPANILLTREGTPKVADFGLAKRLNNSDQTRTGTMIGSVAYMSPEQIEGDSNDRRIDIYGIGATLYQMLTGQPPLLGSTSIETIRMIQSVEPRPVRELNQQVPLDLETICLKCLEKEPSNRFQNVSELIEELARFQQGQPLSIRPIGPVGKCIKWARRKPIIASLSALLVCSLLALTIGGYIAAFYQHKLSEELRVSKKTVEQKAEAAEAINNFLIESWTSPRPSRDGRKVLVADRLQAAVDFLIKEPLTDLSTQAELLHTLGKTQARLGEYQPAKSTLETALQLRNTRLDANDPDLIQTKMDLGDVNLRLGLLDEARALLHSAAQALSSSSKIDERKLITTRNHLAHIQTLEGSHDKASVAIEKNYNRSCQVLGPNDSLSLLTFSDWIRSLRDSNQTEMAYEILMRRLPKLEHELGLANDGVLSLKSTEASLLRRRGEPEKAIQVYEDILPAFEEYYGPDHSMTLVMINNHAAAMSDLGSYDRVAQIHVDLVKRLESVFESTHPKSIMNRIVAGQAMLHCGKPKQAKKYLLSAFENSTALKPGHSARTLSAIEWGGFVASYIEPKQGIKILRTALSEMEASESPNSARMIRLLTNLNFALKADGQLEEALEAIQKAKSLSYQYWGPDHQASITAENNCANALASLRRDDEAIAMYQKVLEKIHRVKNAQSPLAMKTEYNLAMLNRENGNPQSGVRLLKNAVPRMEQHLGNPWLTELARFELGRCLLESGNEQAADQTLRKALKSLEKMLDSRHSGDANAIANQIRTIIRQFDAAKSSVDIDFWKSSEQRLRARTP